MNMGKHMIACLALVGVGIILAVGGVTGSWILLPALACMVMMGWMVWAMGGGHRHGDDRK